VRLIRDIWKFLYELVFGWRKKRVTGPIEGPGIFGTCIQIADVSDGGLAKPWVRVGKALTGDLNSFEVLVRNHCETTIKAGVGLPQFAADLRVAKSDPQPDVTLLVLTEDIPAKQLGYARGDFRLREDQFRSDWKVTLKTGTTSDICGEASDFNKLNWTACTTS